MVSAFPALPRVKEKEARASGRRERKSFRGACTRARLLRACKPRKEEGGRSREAVAPCSSVHSRWRIRRRRRFSLRMRFLRHFARICETIGRESTCLETMQPVHTPARGTQSLANPREWISTAGSDKNSATNLRSNAKMGKCRNRHPHAVPALLLRQLNCLGL